jgi:hypothetical protein
LFLLYFSKKSGSRRWQRHVLLHRPGLLLFLCVAILCCLPSPAAAQSPDAEKPVPILSGSAGYFNFVTAGQNQIDAQINPAGWWKREWSAKERFNVLTAAALTAAK